jgi:2,4-dienoyl-CoA reductase-like NADH-dependent reductase (Old Yellow Enzyme family)
VNPAHARLFEPLTLACGLALKNRVVMAPMTTWSSNDDGTISDDEIPYLDRRASGLGMVMTAACSVMPEGKAFPGQWACNSDTMLPSLRRVADVLHARGTAAILQIHHGGRMCPSALLGHRPYSASAIPAARPGAETPEAMTNDVILRTIDAFTSATRRAIQAGYDGVEIHGANTYLPQQFFSPHSNRRDDEWGGDLEKRMRFPLALLDAVLAAREEATRPFAVGYRLSPEEVEEPGITIDDSIQLCMRLATRPLDWIHVSVRDYRKLSLRHREDARRPTLRIAEAVSSKVPVIGVGRFDSPEETFLALDDGCALVALGRVLLTDPEWMAKVRDDDSRSIHTQLPVEDGDRILTIPEPLYRMLLSVKGWIPLEE